MIYSTVRRCSRNEDNQFEVAIERPRTFWQWILRRPAIQETYVSDDETTWVNKQTKKRIPLGTETEVRNINMVLKDRLWQG